VTSFQIPPAEDLLKAGKEERMNIFRRYFAASRYNRLLIQQTLVKSAFDPSLVKKIKDMESEHNKDFSNTVKRVKKTEYYEEFLSAVTEEDSALQKIIEAYDKRMHTSG